MFSILSPFSAKKGTCHGSNGCKVLKSSKKILSKIRLNSILVFVTSRPISLTQNLRAQRQRITVIGDNNNFSFRKFCFLFHSIFKNSTQLSVVLV